MAGNKYYAKSTQEVLQSYDWLFREKLESMDALARSLYTDLSVALVPKDQIASIMQQYFAEIWEAVAEKEEKKSGKGVPRWIGKRQRRSSSET